MKKLIALLLAVFMAASLSFSAAETLPAEGGFFPALRDWSSGLAQEGQDYKAAVSVAGFSLFSMLIRKDSGITELAVPDLGRVQFSDKALALEAGNRQFVLDLASLREKFRKSDAEKINFKADLEMIKPWLDQGIREIILPSADLGLNFSGLTVHISATDEVIRERTWAWIDKLMEERTTLETLLAHYGRYLKLFIPWLPQTFDELKQAWEAEKANPSFTWPDFSVTADLTYSIGLGGRHISCNADLYCEGLGRAGLTMEMVPARDGSDILASLDTTGEDGSKNAFSLDFHCHGDKSSGVLTIPGNTFTLNAERRTESDTTVHYNAVLDEQKDHGRFLLNAVMDPRDSSLKSELYRTRTDSDEVPEKLAAMDLYTRINGWDWSLALDSTRIALHKSDEEQYGRLKVEVSNAYTSRYVDLWSYRTGGDGFRFKLESNLFNTVDPPIYNLAVGSGGFEFSRLSAGGQQCDLFLKLARKQTENGFELDAEYLNRMVWSEVFNTGDRPSTLKIVRESQAFRADLDWSSYGRQVFAVSVSPERIAWTNVRSTHAITVDENTPEKLVLRMTKDETKELAKLSLALKDDCLKGILSLKGFELIRIVIEPTEKEPIREITKQ